MSSHSDRSHAWLPASGCMQGVWRCCPREDYCRRGYAWRFIVRCTPRVSDTGSPSRQSKGLCDRESEAKRKLGMLLAIFWTLFVDLTCRTMSTASDSVHATRYFVATKRLRAACLVSCDCSLPLRQGKPSTIVAFRMSDPIASESLSLLAPGSRDSILRLNLTTSASSEPVSAGRWSRLASRIT
ncbi:hypothetical protein BO70DRAFT_121198 [Aspergillus heteromorphus CBS 117.55]|uniref:Uncharacterized protein n=1 Tax=Aspergillus heteromorphus CBS 117.55 TaxID=1448321 RepID=A0A317VE45_9EURO|nr:uncharacterized protein BO70DRAFT_121198 [Aspergillus heteromorphus CBS 117.55]PWY71699.1 hypothetical protein BO70DRAFT_121198 [Aspergillus heteromorphus CBS 117.55]